MSGLHVLRNPGTRGDNALQGANCASRRLQGAALDGNSTPPPTLDGPVDPTSQTIAPVCIDANRLECEHQPAPALHAPVRSSRWMKTFLAILATFFFACEVETTGVIWHLGDSNMFLSLPGIHFYEVEHGYEMRVPAAVPGSALARDIGYWEQRFAGAAARGIPDATIVVLGTNDLADENWPLFDTIEEQDVALDRFLGALPDAPVMWIALQEDAPTHPDRRAEFNAALYRAEVRWPKLDVVDLSPCVVVGEDQVHYDDPSKNNLGVEITYWLDEKFGYVFPGAATSILRQGPICSAE